MRTVPRKPQRRDLVEVCTDAHVCDRRSKRTFLRNGNKAIPTVSTLVRTRPLPFIGHSLDTERRIYAKSLK